MIVLWTLIGYLSGSVMYSRLIGQHILRVDLSTVGDGNPGTTNVGRAGGLKWGLLAFTLDTLKGSIPIWIASSTFGVSGWGLVPVGIAPVIGHAFPIFFQLKGGKAVATTFGCWIGLTLWEIPTIGGTLLGIWYGTIENDGWVVMFTVFSVIVYLAVTGHPRYLVAVATLNALVFAYKHRADLQHPPGAQRWVRRAAAAIAR